MMASLSPMLMGMLNSGSSSTSVAPIAPTEFFSADGTVASIRSRANFSVCSTHDMRPAPLKPYSDRRQKASAATRGAWPFMTSISTSIPLMLSGTLNSTPAGPIPPPSAPPILTVSAALASRSLRAVSRVSINAGSGSRLSRSRNRRAASAGDSFSNSSSMPTRASPISTGTRMTTDVRSSPCASFAAPILSGVGASDSWIRWCAKSVSRACSASPNAVVHVANSARATSLSSA
mmetsp:Transcript_5756/g.11724  ORF Transcript_5756/g.11724 Transcript_5756/m.11724 type:complete len:234 (-) Transcript_5756:665-1366(-)